MEKEKFFVPVCEIIDLEKAAVRTSNLASADEPLNDTASDDEEP